jgi:hypothetical protein
MSNYRIYTGNKKALVFPIMGDGYIHLDYSKHIPKGPDGVTHDPATHGIEAHETDDDDDAKYGIWAIKSSFTMEGIITPYDINGFGWRLGADYSGSGTPSIATQYDAGNLDLPFKNKYYSATGNLNTANSYRSGAYFSHEPIAYLAVAINSSVTTITVSSVEDIIGGTNIRIGNEEMEVVSINHTGGTGKTIVVTRAQNGTAAAAHVVNDLIYGDNRLNHKMTIFHNETCQFYLKNITRTNMNQPAEYKIGCVLKGKDSNGNIRTVTVESNSPIITAENEYYGKPVEQPDGADHVFGKPIYLEIEDRVRYHKKIGPSNEQIYLEKYYAAPVLVSASGSRAIFSNQAVDSVDGNFITLQGTTFTGTLLAGSYIKVIGSAKNDGHYKVKTRHSTTQIEVELPYENSAPLMTSVFEFESVVFATPSVLAIHFARYNSQLTFANGASSYYIYDSISADTGNIDMNPHIWMGQNLYGQTSTDNIFSADLVHGKDPTYLGWISDINVTSGHKADIVTLSKCKLVKPIRTVDETEIYVDDARNLNVGDYVWNRAEKMQIDSISGNTLTVERGAVGLTTSLDAYGLTSASNANYIIHPNEEYNFSRNLLADIPDTLFDNVFKMTSGGSSLANSDEYGAHMLVDTWKEAGYVLRPFHLAMSYDNTANRISLFVDGREIDTQIFSEGNLRVSSFVGDGGATVTVNTIDVHALTTNDWVSIEDSGVTNLNGVWKVTVTSDNSFTINCVNNVASATTTAGTLTDVTIRTGVNIQDFEFDATDCYMGSNGATALETRRSSQFMGEIHEFAITKEYKDNFQTIDTLVPNYRNTLLYFRFEGENV